MIRINLLPPEKRKPERPPLARYGLALVDAGLLTVVVLVLLATWIQIANAVGDAKQYRQETAALKPEVDRYDKLFAESRKIEGQIATLKQILDRRSFEFWRVIDAIADVAQANPRIWFDTLEVIDARAAEQKLKTLDPQAAVKASFGIVLRCHSGGVDVKDMTKLRMDLKNDPVLKHLFPIMNFDTSWKVEAQDKFVEKFSLGFEVLLVNSGQKWETAAAPAAAAGEKR